MLLRLNAITNSCTNRAHEYVTVKVGNSDCSEQEVKAYQHINSIETKHAGRLLVRKMEDHFYLSLAAQKYPCLVHKTLSISLQRFRRRLNGRMPLSVLKPTLLHIFPALDFLHTEADMVHTDDLSFLWYSLIGLLTIYRPPREEYTPWVGRKQYSRILRA